MLRCKQINTLFILAQQQISKALMKDVAKSSNAYYGKVPDGGKWTLYAGTTAKGYRLGRIVAPNENGWRRIQDTQCATTACDFKPEVVTHGSDEYEYSLVRRELRTDWICIDSLAFRHAPVEELEHLRDGLARVSRQVHEEFRRSRYLYYCGNKIVVTVDVDPDDPDTPIPTTLCNDVRINTQGFVFETRPDSGEMDERYLRVAVPNEQIFRISGLTLDMLDYAQVRLNYAGDSTLPGTALYDVLLADIRVSNRMALQENELVGGAAAQGAFNIDLNQKYGTMRTIRNYSLREDPYAMRFFPDLEFNSDLPPFDVNNPDTWPRFVRVYPYTKVKAARGVKQEINEFFMYAPFGISTILTGRVMSVLSFPEVESVGPAKKAGGIGYDGTAVWRNPDWECNPNRDKGYWAMRFQLSAKPGHTEEGYAYFHRLINRIDLDPSTCEIIGAQAASDITQYCFDGVSDPYNIGINAAIDNE